MLAGSRGGDDPLAPVRGDAHRALLDVAGVPMLVRVVRALRASASIDGIEVSIDEPEAIAAVEELRVLCDSGDLTVRRSLDSPSRSVRDALGADAAAIVTTADSALLTAEIVDHFVAAADREAADLAVGLVARSVILASHPDTTRTWLRFRDGGYSGANLFAFRTPASTRAAEFWVRAEQFRKRPWRLASVFGPVSLALFALRRLSLDAALARASLAIGCGVSAVRLPFARAAIDVDRPSDLELVRRILSSQER